MIQRNFAAKVASKLLCMKFVAGPKKKSYTVIKAKSCVPAKNDTNGFCRNGCGKMTVYEFKFLDQWSRNLLCTICQNEDHWSPFWLGMQNFQNFTKFNHHSKDAWKTCPNLRMKNFHPQVSVEMQIYDQWSPNLQIIDQWSTKMNC